MTGVVAAAVLTAVVVLLLAMSVKVAAEHERALIYRLGRLLPDVRGPGLFLVIPLVDRVVRVNLLQQTLSDAAGARHFVGEEVEIEGPEHARLRGIPWPARAENGTPLVPGHRGRVERVEDDLRLVVGSLSSPTPEEQT